MSDEDLAQLGNCVETLIKLATIARECGFIEEWPRRRLEEVHDELMLVLCRVDDEPRRRVSAMRAAVEKALAEGAKQ
jgi:hypothetical protein